MDEAKREQLAFTAQQLAHLPKHESWLVLRAEVENRLRRDMLSLTSGREVPQYEFDWKRGFWAGALYVLNIPEHAEDTLEQALERAQALEQRGNE